MKSTKLAVLLLLSLGLARTASAVPFYLETEVATTISGNTTSGFYDVTSLNVETGTASSLYSYTFGGAAATGFWVNISFGSNSQPTLTSAYLKASNGYLWWDSADLALFNSGIYDSITLENDDWATGLRNSNNYHATGHAGLYGTAGAPVVTVHNNVPDASSTVALLGLGMIGLFVAARRRASK